MPERTFDRRPSPPDDRDYPATRALAPTTGTVETRLWRCVPRLDQGEEGDCVGFSIAHALGAFPYPQPVDNALGHQIVDIAKGMDEWAGEDYSGTSVRAGLKAAQSLGLIAEYDRCATTLDAGVAVSHLAPIVIGVNWRESLMDPSAEIEATPVEGAVVGGHAVCVHGYHQRDDLWRIRNSWGEGYGRRGDLFVTTPGLTTLIAEDGEAWIPRKVVA